MALDQNEIDVAVMDERGQMLGWVLVRLATQPKPGSHLEQE
jgi:hypothetical protein